MSGTDVLAHRSMRLAGENIWRGSTCENRPTARPGKPVTNALRRASDFLKTRFTRRLSTFMSPATADRPNSTDLFTTTCGSRLAWFYPCTDRLHSLLSCARAAFISSHSRAIVAGNDPSAQEAACSAALLAAVLCIRARPSSSRLEERGRKRR